MIHLLVIDNSRPSTPQTEEAQVHCCPKSGSTLDLKQKELYRTNYSIVALVLRLSQPSPA